MPTPPTSANHFDHFHINTATLHEWVHHFESDAQSEVDLQPEAIGSDESLAVLPFCHVPLPQSYTTNPPFLQSPWIPATSMAKQQ
jgi:hypothetical protein